VPNQRLVQCQQCDNLFSVSDEEMRRYVVLCSCGARVNSSKGAGSSRQPIPECASQETAPTRRQAAAKRKAAPRRCPECSSCGSTMGTSDPCQDCSTLLQKIADVNHALTLFDTEKIAALRARLLGKRAVKAVGDGFKFAAGIAASVVSGCAGHAYLVAKSTGAMNGGYSADSVLGPEDAEYFERFKDLVDLLEKCEVRLEERQAPQREKLARSSGVISDECRRRESIQWARRVLDG